MKLRDIKQEILNLWGSGEFNNKSELARYIYTKYDLEISAESTRRMITRYINQYFDDEIVTENVKLAKQRQRLQDSNRIERKSFREYARVENAVSAYAEALVEQLKAYGSSLSKNITVGAVVDNDRPDVCGVFQLSDVHANELIDLPHNKYSWDILRKRLRKQVNESIEYFEFRGVKKVLFAVTGDLLNSDRRLDELLSQSTNRAKASVLLAHLIVQAIIDIRSRGYEIDVVSVLGNESRVNKEMTFSNDAVSDNYDFTIMAMVKMALVAARFDGINFLSIDKMEAVIDFGKQKWLFIHDVSKVTDKQGKAQSTIGRYTGRGIIIDFIVGGHIHAFRGTDITCRSGSMAGSNSYNEHSLNLLGRASAVCYVVDGLSRYYQYIDLQHTDENGYEIESKLETYNVKSETKTKQSTTVFKVVI